MNCKVCKFTYSEPRTVPRMLPCGHSYCEECIRNIALASQGFKCFRCGCYFPLDLVKDAPINIDLLDLNDLHFRSMARDSVNTINESNWNTVEGSDRESDQSIKFYTPIKEFITQPQEMIASANKLTPIKDFNRSFILRPDQKCIIENCARKKYVDPSTGVESPFCSEECWSRMNNPNPFIKRF